MVKLFSKGFFNYLFFFKKRKKLSLGLYGPPNAGKSTLANKIIFDILGEDAGKFETSSVEHETRSVQKVEKLEMKKGGKTINFSLIDTPGIATKIDFEDFVKKGMKKSDAKERAKEATQGVIESIKWLDNVDAVLVVIDSTLNPYNQVNITLIANLVAKKKKLIIVANKSDLKSSSIEKIQLVFPDYTLVGISAKTGEGVEELYDAIFTEFY
ncbi:MAG: Era-like GTP-binding protein [Candidatus Woesearchaeota archaeon]|jgi:GTP-binding protein Era|nr:Era-like GTP-binding protein [Candidatus Woesearchaeota archaeon]